MTQKDYQKLHEISRYIKTLSGIAHLLEWDQETHMPSAATGIRAEQMEILAGIIHKEQTGPKFSTALKKLIDMKNGKIKSNSLNPAQQVALKEWRRDYLHDTALPSKFVEEFAKLTTQAMHAWKHAKKENAFNQFAPFLEKIITLSRKKADLLKYKDHPYDALLDQYEHDMTSKEVGKIFDDLQNSIVALLKKIKTAKQVDDSFLHGKFDTQKQLEFARVILDCMGYEKDKGRLDISAHPFSSSSHPTDSRITTRIHSTSLISNISVVLHEGGHSLYEMGLPVEHYGSPLGEAISLGVHESQSRWWETRIGQSKPFWQYFLPLLKKQFKGQLDKVTLEDFYRGINKVEPSFIRVDADEVTYPLHVILRFELEKSLIEGSLKVKEIPEAWNAKMVQLLGIKPKNNSEGCLQDVHWSMGAFGYFPTYALGNLYAGHLFPAFEKKYPDWAKRIAKGDLLFIKEWLHDIVYKHGRRYNSKELLKKATGKNFSADAYVEYLNDKYKSIYNLK